MRLILVRHGPAGRPDPNRWPDDGHRPLTSRGIKRTRVAAAGVARVEPEVSVIATSPLTRALQTARIFARALDPGRIEELAALAPGGPAQQVVDYLAAHAGERSVLLVGHAPDLGDLAGLLVFGRAGSFDIKKAGSCAISFDGEVRPGAGALSWFASRSMFSRLRRGKARV